MLVFTLSNPPAFFISTSLLPAQGTPECSPLLGGTETKFNYLWVLVSLQVMLVSLQEPDGRTKNRTEGTSSTTSQVRVPPLVLRGTLGAWEPPRALEMILCVVPGV
jgi:hypothetical protein